MTSLSEFKEAFNLFDKNGDGKVTLGELETVMRNMGQRPTQGDLQQVLAEFDTDGKHRGRCGRIWPPAARFQVCLFVYLFLFYVLAPSNY